jgi:glucose-6-phosphate-specific signal transduction histidine kinase
VPVELDVGVHRQWGESAEVAAYYIVAEALTNAAKHAQASQVKYASKALVLTCVCRFETMESAVPTRPRDPGLIGLRDRVEALGGKMVISSHAGSGTSLFGQLAVRRPMITTVEQVDLFWSVRG